MLQTHHSIVLLIAMLQTHHKMVLLIIGTALLAASSKPPTAIPRLLGHLEALTVAPKHPWHPNLQSNPRRKKNKITWTTQNSGSQPSEGRTNSGPRRKHPRSFEDSWLQCPLSPAATGSSPGVAGLNDTLTATAMQCTLKFPKPWKANCKRTTLQINLAWNT